MHHFCVPWNYWNTCYTVQTTQRRSSVYLHFRGLHMDLLSEKHKSIYERKIILITDPSMVMVEKLFPEMRANEMQALCGRHHKVSPSPCPHLNTNKSVNHEVIWKWQITVSDLSRDWVRVWLFQHRQTGRSDGYGNVTGLKFEGPRSRTCTPIKNSLIFETGIWANSPLEIREMRATALKRCSGTNTNVNRNLFCCSMVW